jgi:uncharacterized membrane protein YgcG/predicted nucleic acid-binding protein
MRATFALLAALLVLAVAAPARAAEQISRFDVLVEVETDGDIVVTETLDVVAEGVEIRRGIFRDLPRYYERDGERFLYDYDIVSVRRDGAEDAYETSTEGNAFRIRIGDEDVLLAHGAHAYELRYRVKNQVRYFDAYDEVYWNVTGNYWAFPILEARATVALPPGARVTQTAGYTGALGQSGDAFTYAQSGDRHTFQTTRTLQRGEGLTVAVGFEKGLVDPPSAADQGGLWWQRYGALAILIASLGGLFWFLYRSWERVGRDPQKGPVFPRYEAPQGYSPAAAHHIYYRGLSGHRALIATLMHLAVKGRLLIDASDKKSTELTLKESAASPPGIAAEDLALERGIFAGRSFKSLGKKYDAGFTSVYSSFRQTLSRKYGSAYFRWNLGYTILALVLTIALVVFAVAQSVNWTGWHTLAVVAFAALNVAFLYFMPAPTVKGQAVRTEIEGFRLYMETAEKLQLNAAEPGSDAPPPMTAERYEKFLPYAVALGVEEPWTKHFERLLPQEASNYNPAWSSGNFSGSRAASAMSGALVANMSSGVSSAMPQSSGSSGSGGGGSSGGGGGGGGGGGW